MPKVDRSTTVDTLQINRSTTIDGIMSLITSRNETYQANDIFSQAEIAESPIQGSDRWDAWKLLMLPNVKFTSDNKDATLEKLDEDTKYELAPSVEVMLFLENECSEEELIAELEVIANKLHPGYFCLGEIILAINKYKPELLSSQLIITLLDTYYILDGDRVVPALNILGGLYETDTQIVLKIIEHAEDTQYIQDCILFGQVHKDLYKSEEVMRAVLDLDWKFCPSDDREFLIAASELLDTSLILNPDFMRYAVMKRPEMLAVAPIEIRSDHRIIESAGLKDALPFASLEILCNQDGILDKMMSRHGADWFVDQSKIQTKGLMRDSTLISFLTKSKWALLYILSSASPVSIQAQGFLQQELTQLQCDFPLLHSAITIIRSYLHKGSNFTTNSLHEIFPDVFWQELLVTYNPEDEEIIRTEFMPYLTNKEVLSKSIISAGIKPILIHALLRNQTSDMLNIIKGYFNYPDVKRLTCLLMDASDITSSWNYYNNPNLNGNCWDYFRHNPANIFILFSQIGINVGPFTTRNLGAVSLVDLYKKLSSFSIEIITEGLHDPVSLEKTFTFNDIDLEVMKGITNKQGNSSSSARLFKDKRDYDDNDNGDQSSSAKRPCSSMTRS